LKLRDPFSQTVGFFSVECNRGIIHLFE